MLRREGLYQSQVAEWANIDAAPRRCHGATDAGGHRRAHRASGASAGGREAALARENTRLARELAKSQAVVEISRK